MTAREVKSTFSDNNDMKIKFLPCWTCKFGKNISRNKLKYDLMKINCVFGIKVVSRPKTRIKLRTPQASPSNLSVCQKTVNQVRPLLIGRAFTFHHFGGWELRKGLNKIRYVLKKRWEKKWLVSPLETTADNWIPLCPCKEIEGKLCVRDWSFVDVVQMTQIGNSSKNLARYSLWMTGVHGKQILDSTLLCLIRSLCQGNFC